MPGRRRYFVAIVVTWLYAVACPAYGQDYAIGADVSFLAQSEHQGVVFKDNGTPTPGLQILKNHGYGWIRLRLFHTPSTLPNNLEYTIAMARDARKLGFKFLLDYHYADDWADPGKQPIPRAWQGKSHKDLVQAVFESATRSRTEWCGRTGNFQTTGTISRSSSMPASTAWMLAGETALGRKS